MQQQNFSKFPVLNTERLVLRRLALTDANEIYQSRSDAKVAELIGKAPFTTIDQAVSYINMIDGVINKNESIFWAISYKSTTALIGTICLWNFDIPNATVELGYELLEAFRGKGIMAEAMVSVIGYAFDEMGVEKIIACPSVENLPSVKLLEKMGFELTQDNFSNTHEGVPGMLTYIITAGK
ncbi:GNAT family N-acetyltransferase [Pedobacter jeongneungensis]|uniref:GNAT family N-acetyltransferase n=1 Tax=Pedobacter jeongneungensis TaxID=947309 RepID=UPI000468B544|nr:GNAT family N-acetyltransferase [Pedobacter jeongneungensis]